MSRCLVGFSVLFVAALALSGGSARADYRSGQPSGHQWLWQCDGIPRDEAKFQCFVRLFLLDVDSSRDPADELPRIDARLVKIGGFARAWCHPAMHEVAASTRSSTTSRSRRSSTTSRARSTRTAQPASAWGS